MSAEKYNKNWLILISKDSMLYSSISKLEETKWSTVCLPNTRELLQLVEEGISPRYVVWHVPIFREIHLKFCIQWKKKYTNTRLLVVIDKEVHLQLNKDYSFDKIIDFCILGNNYEKISDFIQKDTRDIFLSPLKKQSSPLYIPIYPGIKVNPSLRYLDNNGSIISLPAKEYELLMYLVKQRGNFVTIEQILLSVWDEFSSPENARQMIYKLRKKLYRNTPPYNILLYVRGTGYTLVDRKDSPLLSTKA
ncbi:helix-turn-helix domain-containing protein [Bacillus infantis]|uniref:Helix-turn-helix domain-containing protein n=1 Tax=Bacillus infantis TaxID=324767 RepID=A0A5D4SCD1_9BACI|nr:helix-turn-helix domain-containing protein [Bacillus infantis]TYS60639.1 helix-turn-helix domain-containing protein [Bacillus infantis]